MTQHLPTLIKKFLRSNPLKSARDIAKNLDATRQEINSVLYRHPGIFNSIGSDPPLWRLVSMDESGNHGEKSTTSNSSNNIDDTKEEFVVGSKHAIESQPISTREIEIADMHYLVNQLRSLKFIELSSTPNPKILSEVITRAWIKLNIPEEFKIRFQKFMKEHHLAENKITLGELFAELSTAGNSEILRNLHLLILLNGYISIVDLVKFAQEGRLKDHPDFALVEFRRTDPTIERLTEDLLIINLRANGETLRSVALQFGLTKERIRQRQRDLAIYGINFSPSLIRLGRKLTSDERKKEVICQYILKFPGCTVDEIQESLQMSRSEIRQLLPKTYKKFLAPTRRIANSSMTKAEILDAIRFASTLEYPLSGPGFDELLKSNAIKCVSRVRILQIFGTWSHACDLAGVESLLPGRQSYDRNWSETDLWEYLMDFLLSNPESFSFGTYDGWARERPGDRPSSGTLRNYLGPWSEVLSTALLKLRDDQYHEIFKQNQESGVNKG